METKDGRDQVNERRLVGDLKRAEQTRARDVAGAAVHFDAPPVVRALQREHCVFRNFQLDDGEPAVAPEREQVNGACARARLLRRPKLRVERREDETGIEPRDVAP